MKNNQFDKNGLSLINIIISIALIAGTFISGYLYFSSRRSEETAVEPARAKEVEILKLDGAGIAKSFIEAPGSIRAETQIDVPAMAGGTIRGVYFNIGDNIVQNQVLATVYDSTVMANLNTARANVSNLRVNLLSTERIADESIRQAEIGVQSARQQVEAAEIALNTAEDNYNSAKSLKERSGQDLKTSSINNFKGNLNFIFSTLQEIDYVLMVNGAYRHPGLDQNILGAEDRATVQKAESAYRQAKKAYTELNSTELNLSNITENTGKMVNALGSLKNAVDSVLIVLDKTITSEAYFPPSALTALKASYVNLRANTVSTLNAAESAKQALNNQALIDNRELSPLENAVAAAKNQLSISKTGLLNAQAGVNSAVKARDQQILAAKTSLDNAQGQLSLAGLQAADLSIKSPISGKITGKFAEIGTEVNPGQRIAEVSKIDLLVIDIDIPTERIDKIKQGQRAYINTDKSELEAVIYKIYPTADPISKKVRVEIAYDNSGKELIAGAFAQVKIPLVEEGEIGRYLIPLRALTITPDQKYVFIVENGKAKKTVVETGKTEGETIEITSGLEPGMEIIVNGAKSVNEGEEVVVA
jgi:HlyD family secretion protein